MSNGDGETTKSDRKAVKAEKCVKNDVDALTFDGEVLRGAADALNGDGNVSKGDGEA